MTKNQIGVSRQAGGYLCSQLYAGGDDYYSRWEKRTGLKVREATKQRREQKLARAANVVMAASISAWLKSKPERTLSSAASVYGVKR